MLFINVHVTIHTTLTRGVTGGPCSSYVKDVLLPMVLCAIVTLTGHIADLTGCGCLLNKMNCTIFRISLLILSAVHQPGETAERWTTLGFCKLPWCKSVHSVVWVRWLLRGSSLQRWSCHLASSSASAICFIVLHFASALCCYKLKLISLTIFFMLIFLAIFS